MRHVACVESSHSADRSRPSQSYLKKLVLHARRKEEETRPRGRPDRRCRDLQDQAGLAEPERRIWIIRASRRLLGAMINPSVPLSGVGAGTRKNLASGPSQWTAAVAVRASSDSRAGAPMAGHGDNVGRLDPVAGQLDRRRLRHGDSITSPRAVRPTNGREAKPGLARAFGPANSQRVGSPERRYARFAGSAGPSAPAAGV
jgi:hypothetical protein